ncbi:MAG: type III-B CRISPR module RAMP protein Cmr4 [Thermodesulfobacteriota bacterium]|nr:type III-B CRISPR module RAMP protein Cmr4 [Thermodesulfobacteriota bacterium]
MKQSKKFFGLAIDPLHIGAGGYRLGRVDNTIVRDPGTNIPKIPGSSISGVCRNYAIYGLDGDERTSAEECARHSDIKIQNNCGKCIICNTFGFASGSDKKNQMGLVKFFDAMIVAFPVATMNGPVWVTTSASLAELGLKNITEPGEEEIHTSFDVPGKKLNLGWLYLDAKEKDISLPEQIGDSPQIQEIKKRLVICSQYLFSEIINNNLEVRTSVSIDFATGAAKPGALFTYEAIPRGTLLAFDLAVDSYRCNKIHTVEKVWEVAESGLRLFEVMGLGGMNTRGFGRMKVTNL